MEAFAKQEAVMSIRDDGNFQQVVVSVRGMVELCVEDVIRIDEWLTKWAQHHGDIRLPSTPTGSEISVHELVVWHQGTNRLYIKVDGIMAILGPGGVGQLLNWVGVWLDKIGFSGGGGI